MTESNNPVVITFDEADFSGFQQSTSYPPTLVQKSSTSCWSICKMIYIMGIIFLGSSLIILLALGRTLTSWIKCTNDTRQCDDFAFASILLALPFALVFWQFPHRCLGRCCRWNLFSFCCQVKSGPYLTMGVIYTISLVLVVIAHLIGYPIMKYIVGSDALIFSWRTSAMGFIVIYFFLYLIILGGALIIKTKYFSEPTSTIQDPLN